MPSAGPPPRDGGVYIAFMSFTLTKPTHTGPAGRSLDLAMTQPLRTGPTHCGDSTPPLDKGSESLVSIRN